eukprot:8584898-Pyramimonas_sp.AAC.1
MLAAMLSLTSMGTAAVLTPVFTQHFLGSTVSMPFGPLFLSQLQVLSTRRPSDACSVNNINGHDRLRIR